MNKPLAPLGYGGYEKLRLPKVPVEPQLQASTPGTSHLHAQQGAVVALSTSRDERHDLAGLIHWLLGDAVHWKLEIHSPHFKGHPGSSCITPLETML